MVLRPGSYSIHAEKRSYNEQVRADDDVISLRKKKMVLQTSTIVSHNKAVIYNRSSEERVIRHCSDSV